MGGIVPPRAAFFSSRRPFGSRPHSRCASACLIAPPQHPHPPSHPPKDHDFLHRETLHRPGARAPLSLREARDAAPWPQQAAPDVDPDGFQDKSAVGRTSTCAASYLFDSDGVALTCAFGCQTRPRRPRRVLSAKSFRKRAFIVPFRPIWRWLTSPSDKMKILTSA